MSTPIREGIGPHDCLLVQNSIPFSFPAQVSQFIVEQTINSYGKS